MIIWTLVAKPESFSGSKKGAACRKRRHCLLQGSERVDQVKLIAVQVRFLGSSGYSRSSHRIQETRVQSAAMPQRKAGRGVAAYPVERIDAMLQNVCRSPLIALVKRGDHGFLFLAQPGVADLQIALGFLLAQADVRHVGLVLLSQTRQHSSRRTERVVGRAQVVFEFKQDIDWPTVVPCLDLVVQNEIRVVQFCTEVRDALR